MVRLGLVAGVFMFLLTLLPPTNAKVIPFANATDSSNSFRLKWRFPAEGFRFSAVSPNGTEILLTSQYNGFHLYDLSGKLLHDFPMQLAAWGDFSPDGRSLVLLQQFLTEGDKLSIVNASTFRPEWNFTQDRIHYAAVSNNASRIAIYGGVQEPNGHWRSRFLVVDRSLGTVFNLTLSDPVSWSSQLSEPSISGDGRYAVVGIYNGFQISGWLYFVDLVNRKSWNTTVPGGVSHSRISRDGSLIAAVSYPSSLFAYKPDGSISWMAQLPGYVGPFSLSDDGSLVTASGDMAPEQSGSSRSGFVVSYDALGRRLWEHYTASPVKAFASHGTGVMVVVGDRDGHLHAVGRSGMLLWERGYVSELNSAAVGGAQTSPVVVAVAGGIATYVLNSQGGLLWRKEGLSLTQFSNSASVSDDGDRILLGSDNGVNILDGEGKMIFSIPTPRRAGFRNPSVLSSNGRVLVVASMPEYGGIVVLAWYDATNGQQMRNVTIDRAYSVDSMSISSDGSLLAVSGGIRNASYIYAYDLEGKMQWKQLTSFRQADPYYHDIAWVESVVAVSADGSYVAAGRQENEEYKGGHCCSVGPNNGVVLFNRQGQLLWNYTTQHPVLQVAISGSGEHVEAGGISQIFEFDKTGTLLWNFSVSEGMVAAARLTDRFVAGHYGGGLFLGNSSGVYWQMGVDGHVSSVAISNDGQVVAALISRDFPNEARLVYLLDGQGRFLGNFTYPQYSSFSRVTVAGNGCCVVAPLLFSEGGGLYYFTKAGETGAATGTQIAGFSFEAIAVGIILGLLIATRVGKRKRLRDR